MKNILMIAVDDLRPELNCFGKQKLITPNLDKLADAGMLYERAYCNFPQCMPSRASLMTGIRPHTFCNWSNQLTPNGELTLPGLLKQNGMKTISVGKVYHEPLDDAYSWDELHMDSFQPGVNGGMDQFFHDYQFEENIKKTTVKRSVEFSKFQSRIKEFPPLFECADSPDENYIDYKVASKGIDRLMAHKDSDQPLFLSVGFLRPHLPWIAPKKYWDLYDRDEIDLADNPFFPENGVGKGDFCDIKHYFDDEISETFSDIGRYEDDDFPVLTEDKQRELIHAYWAAVSFMDAQVGRVLDALEASGMADDTAVLFWGDNGYHLGEHKLWSKITNFDESTRIPLMVKVPNVTTGERTSSLVEMVDVYPTICNILGIEQPEHLEGVPLPLKGDEVTKDEAYTVSWSGETIITDSFRLTYYPKAGVEKSLHIIEGRGSYELFDHRNDPKENVNVIGKPEYAEVVAELKAKLHAQYPH